MVDSRSLLVQFRHVVARLCVVSTAGLPVHSRGVFIVLLHAISCFVCNARVEAASRLVSVAGLLEQLCGQGIVMRNAGTSRVQPPKTYTAERYFGCA
jgi:hypothetical protein